MKRTIALCGMRSLVLSVVFQAGYIAAVVALCGLLVQPAQAEPVDSLAVEAESVDSLAVKKQDFSFLRGSIRVGTKVISGRMMAAVFASRIESPEGDDGIGAAALGYYVGFFLGYPLGVYLADMRESSFWLTFIGNCVGMWGANKLLDSGRESPSERSKWAAWITLLGTPVLASELSRMDAVTGPPKRPKQSQDLRFSFGLVPDIKRGVSAIATLRF